MTASNPAHSAISYSYDPLGRRAEKAVDGAATFFVDDGSTEVAEYTAGSTLERRYIPGNAIDEPIAMIDYTVSGNPKSFFHEDKIGSVIAMSDDSGAITEGPYTYDAFGNTSAAGGEPYKFTGQRLDPETGLYYYRARYYSASLGRFLQTDPIGYKDDVDSYAYVGNDPANKVDVTGTNAGDSSCQNMGGCRILYASGEHMITVGGYRVHSGGSTSSGTNGGSFDNGVYNGGASLIPASSSQITIDLQNKNWQVTFTQERMQHVLDRHGHGRPDPAAGEYSKALSNPSMQVTLAAMTIDLGSVVGSGNSPNSIKMEYSFPSSIGQTGSFRGQANMSTQNNMIILQQTGPNSYNVVTQYPVRY